MMDLVLETVYGKMQIGLANNIYHKLIYDEEKTPKTYKISCLLDTAASGNYGNNNTKVQNKKKIQPGSDINVGCTNKRVLSQTGEGELPFDNVPKGTEDIQLFNDMHSPLLSGRKFFKKGCIFVFILNIRILSREQPEN